MTEEDFRISRSGPWDDEETSNSLSGTDKLIQSLKDIFLSGDHSDVIIRVQKQEFQTHRLILVLRSPVFAAMFRHDTIERNTNAVTIEDCNPETFRAFLCYLYSGELENVSLENVIDLYNVADKYQVEEVKSKCVKFMLNNMLCDNICEFISLALKHKERKLLKGTSDYFVRNLKDIIMTVQWQLFLKNYPNESNELYIKAIKNLIPD